MGKHADAIQSAVQSATDACIIWVFCKNKRGYGLTQVDGESTGAHRVVCRLVHGEPPEGKPFACHSCNNPSCINPRHLRWASPWENMQDKRNNPNIKPKRVLPDDIIEEIRASVLTNKELAAMYKVSCRMIGRMRSALKGFSPCTKREKSGQSKLEGSDVLAIRRSKKSVEALAKRYGISVDSVKAIKARRTWKWLK